MEKSFGSHPVNKEDHGTCKKGTYMAKMMVVVPMATLVRRQH
jgi:hypothetical protein